MPDSCTGYGQTCPCEDCQWGRAVAAKMSREMEQLSQRWGPLFQTYCWLRNWQVGLRGSVCGNTGMSLMKPVVWIGLGFLIGMLAIGLRQHPQKSQLDCSPISVIAEPGQEPLPNNWGRAPGGVLKDDPCPAGQMLTRTALRTVLSQRDFELWWESQHDMTRWK